MNQSHTTSERAFHKDALLRRAWTEIEPELAAHGYELVEVELGQQGSSPVLRLFVDREGGITLDNCAEISRIISHYLDAIEFLDQRYSLEVSSPGIDRYIRKPADFERFKGQAVKVRTVAPVDGKKRFKGTLEEYADGMITVQTEGRKIQVHLENLQKAQLDR